jgi:hypothetical protein
MAIAWFLTGMSLIMEYGGSGLDRFEIQSEPVMLEGVYQALTPPISRPGCLDPDPEICRLARIHAPNPWQPEIPADSMVLLYALAGLVMGFCAVWVLTLAPLPRLSAESTADDAPPV